MVHHWFSRPVVSGEYLLFVLHGWPIIFKLHIPSQEVHIECVLPFDVVMPWEMDYVSLAKGYKKIILFPHFGYMVIEYDIESHTFKKIDISDKINKSGNGPLYNYVYNYNHYSIAQGLMTTTLIVYDEEKDGYLYIDVSELFYKKYGIELKDNAFMAGEVNDNNIYIPIRDKNWLLKINIDSWSLERIVVGNAGEQWNSVAFYEERIYLSAARKLLLVEYDTKDKTCKYLPLNEYSDWLEGQEKKGCPFSKIVCTDNLLHCFPFYAGSMVEIDMETGKISSEKYSLGRDGTFCGAHYESGRIWSFVRQVDEDYIMLVKGSNKEKIHINFSNEIVNILYRFYLAGKKVSYEGNLYNISQFLENI